MGTVAIVLAACGGNDKPAPTPARAPGPGEQQLNVELTNFKFTPKAFAFTVGDTVEFRLFAKDIIHTFTVKALGIDWSLRGGETQDQTFTFTRPGTFKLVCTVPGHEAAGMVGTVTVTQ